jgi:hypothetical protein
VKATIKHLNLDYEKDRSPAIDQTALARLSLEQKRSIRPIHCRESDDLRLHAEDREARKIDSPLIQVSETPNAMAEFVSRGSLAEVMVNIEALSPHD